MADPMLNGNWTAAERMPKRVVVEFSADEYRALQAACSGRRPRWSGLSLAAPRAS
jgi:hypothetical protein